jgi:hypothetical protein
LNLTYPADLPWLGVPRDHVLTRDAHALLYTTLPDIGAAHLPVWFEWIPGSSRDWAERALQPPVQTAIKDEQAHNQYGYELAPLARYDITARVLSAKRYTDDPIADLSPLDLLLAWGRLSRLEIARQLSVSQYSRFGFFESSGDSGITSADLYDKVANTHCIAANDAVLQTLLNVRRYDLVRLRGVLVAAKKPQINLTWRSSTTRTDDGPGACEIVYIETIEVLPP